MYNFELSFMINLFCHFCHYSISYRDTKTKRRRDKRYESRSGSGNTIWIWLLTGMFVGILGAAIIYMMIMGSSTAKKYKPLAEKNPTHHANHVSQTGQTNQGRSHNSTKKQQPDNTTQFEFYNLLPGTGDSNSGASAANTSQTNTNANAATIATSKETHVSTVPITTAPATPTVASKTTSTKAAANTAINKSKNKSHTTAPVVSLNGEPVIATNGPVKQTPNPHSSPKAPYPVSSPVVKDQPKLSDLTQLKDKLPHKPVNKLAAAQYLVQVGLFRKLNQADELKANLALQGFSPFIQRFNAQDGTWFRVCVGPFATDAKAKQQKERLDKKHIKSIVVLQGGGINP